jgi:hypothetical protein
VIEIPHSELQDDTAIYAFSWRGDDDDAIIDGVLASSVAGVSLTFGPTMAVAHWPAWLRAITHFDEVGGQAQLWLDPHRLAERDAASFWALDMRGIRSRRTFAAFLHDLAEAISRLAADPADIQRQAAETCRGIARALTYEAQGPVPLPTSQPELFWPASLPLLVDEHDVGALRQHVRLTYLLPRVGGLLAEGCSLRLFRSEHAFGAEFRELPGDCLPAAIRPACLEDSLGSLLRFEIGRGGEGAFLKGKADAGPALRIVHAVVRQVSRDLTVDPALRSLAGFGGEVWKHWLAAMPDLLASASPMPLDTLFDH